MTRFAQPVVAIVGPTASGKSELALSLAQRIGGEVVSADSQQVYRGMDIGTGKISAKIREQVPHHLLDIADPDEQMTVARFLSHADRTLDDIARRKVPVVIAGGTMLYVRVLCFGLFLSPPADRSLREQLSRLAEQEGAEKVWERLAQIDPISAQRLRPTDLRRTIRAIEVTETTGIAMSEHQRRHDFRVLATRFPVRFVGLTYDRDELNRRIEKRVEAMIAEGWIAEVEQLRARGFGPHLASQRAIGYAELHKFLEDGGDIAETKVKIVKNSMRYARRQLSWYRADPRVKWSRGAQAVDLAELERYLLGSS